MTSPLTEARMILFLESQADSGKRNVGTINERRWLQDDFRILVASFVGSGSRDWPAASARRHSEEVLLLDE